MFKSKKWLIFLIPLTLFIWGYVGLQVYEGMNPELPPLEKVDKSRFRESVTKNKELIPFKDPEFDPFMGTQFKKKVPDNQNISDSTAVLIPKKKAVNWPALTYMGFIKDKNSSRKVAAIQINGVVQTFYKNQIIDSIQLLDATGTFARVKYKKEIKSIEKY